jgi:beta-lactam-binding protein with PASTA domain
VTMPNVVGMTQQGATATLESDGLTVSAGTTSECGKFGDGIVVTQSPSAGTSVPANTSTTIAVCDVTPVP